LIIEKLKGEKSFWKPFLDYLPETNETLSTVSPTQPRHSECSVPLQNEVQRKDDTILDRLTENRAQFEKNKLRFQTFIEVNIQEINTMAGTTYAVEEVMALWEWAWMNLNTRCFGIH